MSMRVATSSMFEYTPRAVGRQQTSIAKIQAQIASGKRIMSPSDDPSGAARSIDLRQSLQTLTQIQQNQTTVKNRLEQAEGSIASAIELVQGILENTVVSNNASLSDADLRTMAATVRGSMQEIAGLANTTDSEGKFVFAGYAADSKPFIEVGGIYTYQGDTGRREAQVGFQRRMQVNDPGSEVFEGVLSGNGVFSAMAAGTNTGTAVVKSATVQNYGALTGDAYAIVFDDTSGTMRYDVVNTTTGTTVSSGTPYTAGSAIQFDGMQVSVQGAPVNGDQITATPSSERSIFAIISELTTALEQPRVTDADRAKLQNELFRLHSDLNQGLDKLIDTRSRIGSRLHELETFSDMVADSATVLEIDLGAVEDLDYGTAVTELMKRQTVFEAAKLSYMKIVGSSMFDLMR